MKKLRERMARNKRSFAWFRLILLAVSWIVLFSSIVYADDCMRDITRAED